MRERMERFASFPFSVSCVSHSSVDVLDNHSRRSRAERPPSPPAVLDAAGEKETKVKGLSGTNISLGIQKAVMKGIKSFSHLFSEREDEDEGMEIEIGYPTDVQHVAHIGLDEPGKVSLADAMGRAPELFSLTPLALRQFELAMNHA